MTELPGAAAGPEDGRISDGLAVLQALERSLGRRHSDRTPPWQELGFPVIDRGRYAIFPLAVAPAQVGAEQVSKDLSAMRYSLQRSCVHFYGGDDVHGELDIGTEDGYGRKLVEAGAVVAGPVWIGLWVIQRFGVVLAHSIDRGRAMETLALHIVPVDWVLYRPVNSGTKREASRYRRVVRDRDAVDVAWSWPLPGPDAS
ncbi:hypothetical protein ACIRPK_36045 [Kitasatospora sp. NPDC101801]|uniref:hypothetical protein n=1 Tax=Kitasatospora sp. NPDC101801 TaxID=3364103 RepID=UPI00381AE0BE